MEAAVLITLSPAECPWESLMTFRLSISIRMIQNGMFSLIASSRSMDSLSFVNSPVMES